MDRFCGKAEQFFSLRAGLLASLNGRFRAGVVSNFFGNLRCRPRGGRPGRSFEVVIDSGRVGRQQARRPHLPARPGAAPPAAWQVIFIGDSYERDMVPSDELGMRTVWLKGPNPRIPEDAPPVDAVITRLAELEALVP